MACVCRVVFFFYTRKGKYEGISVFILHTAVPIYSKQHINRASVEIN